MKYGMTLILFSFLLTVKPGCQAVKDLEVCQEKNGNLQTKGETLETKLVEAQLAQIEQARTLTGVMMNMEDQLEIAQSHLQKRTSELEQIQNEMDTLLQTLSNSKELIATLQAELDQLRRSIVDQPKDLSAEEPDSEG